MNRVVHVAVEDSFWDVATAIGTVLAVLVAVWLGASAQRSVARDRHERERHDLWKQAHRVWVWAERVGELVDTAATAAGGPLLPKQPMYRIVFHNASNKPIYGARVEYHMYERTPEGAPNQPPPGEGESRDLGLIPPRTRRHVDIPINRALWIEPYEQANGDLNATFADAEHNSWKIAGNQPLELMRTRVEMIAQRKLIERRIPKKPDGGPGEWCVWAWRRYNVWRMGQG
ncbi:hypothetical protein [Cellulomonas xylanilytica]|uniref:Uncharacterized protein n=1 Tax=Cellulomonas xylanilytica TaxID=233583 RepID=A0A510V3D8_9CELL|nr:hypothetical protein [Cellulomonas xylanilytica]GEK19635.1 hypothetical protein CXY01_01550 [Cellulomonas xylanilytica]